MRTGHARTPSSGCAASTATAGNGSPPGAGELEDDGYEDRSLAYQRLLRELIDAQRAVIVRLRNEGTSATR